MVCNACYRALEIESARGMEADWSIYLPQYTGLCLWGTLHLFLAEFSTRVPWTGRHGSKHLARRAVSMAGNQVTNKTRSASSSTMFCHPQKCDLASQAFAVYRSCRALCDSSLRWPWAITRTHFITLMKKLSSQCYEKKDCLIQMGCQVPYQTWCVMPSWRDHVITVVFVAPQVSESCKLLVIPWIGKVQPGWCRLVSCFLRLHTCLSWVNTGNS